jgi:hypothetical protein
MKPPNTQPRQESGVSSPGGRSHSGPLLPEQILPLRLANHHLAAHLLSDPAQLVSELGAVQAQDYPAAKWAVALRLRDTTHQQVEDAFAAGRILRTHVLRPTWHFVAPADIRWLLALTSPRIKMGMASYTRDLGLDTAFLARCAAVIARALEGGNSLTRAELGAALRQAGIVVRDGPTLGHIVAHAELDALVCSGPPRGHHHTYALLDERVPAAPSLPADESLAELTWRYFSSHGPALVSDCAWWSGLTVGEVRRGLELNTWRLDRETIDKCAYWFRPGSRPAMPEAVYLLPNYDEYTVAYRVRDRYYDQAVNWTGDPRQDVPFRNAVVVGGRVVGRWKRSVSHQRLMIEVRWAIKPSDQDWCGLHSAAERYGAYLGLRTEVVEPAD